MENGRDICFNFSQICRICLSQGGVMSTVFEDAGPETLPLHNKIMACAAVQIYPGDGLPTLICDRCVYQAERSYDFKEQCELSDATLRNYIKSQSLQENNMFNASELEAMKNQIFGIVNHEGENEEYPVPSCCMDYDDNHPEMQNGMPHEENPYNLDKEQGLSMQETRSLEQHWPSIGTYAFSADENNFIFEKHGTVYHSGNLVVNQDDVISIVHVVDPNSALIDSEIEPENCATPKQPRPPSFRIKNPFFQRRAKNALKHSKKSLALAARSARNDRPYTCPVCSKSFAQRAHLARHELVHTGERPFGCSICGKAFADSSTLTTHMRTHTGERPFICDVCGKAFAGRSDLRKHAVIHTGRRPYVCSVCNKAFTRSTNLKKHARIHSGVRPHACRECAKTFAAKGDLTRHALIHSGCKPFVCIICNVAFARRDKLTRHVKTHSRDKVPHI